MSASHATAQIAQRSALAQAELLEKQKHLMEAENELKNLKAQAHSMAAQRGALEREKRKCQITQSALQKLSAEHKVYKGIGRVFVARKVPELLEEQIKHEKTCELESGRISDEGARLGAVIDQKDVALTQQLNEFAATLRAIETAAASQE